MSTALKMTPPAEKAVSGDFVDINGERYYAIHNVDMMPPFFVSVVSSSDHWLFVSSTGGLSAGRVSPDTALFPYVTVDRIHESVLHTGPRTFIRVATRDGVVGWEPFNAQHDGIWQTARHLYKNLLGNKLCFSEINNDLGLEFRYTWATSDEYGFVRSAEIRNLGNEARSVEILDGLQNLLPAGTPKFTQTNSSNLVDAYKWTELDRNSGLAMFTLYSGITDRAEPSESLKANTAFCLGLEAPTVLISSEQLDRFRRGETLETEAHKRGIRGAYFVNAAFEVEPGAVQSWQIVTNIELGQASVVALQNELVDTSALESKLDASIREGSDELARIMAMSDGFQETAEENVALRHYANVLFNVLRGGYFPDNYNVAAWDFRSTVRAFNKDVYDRNAGFLTALPDKLGFGELLTRVKGEGDTQLERLCLEYLPITFGRRHGDPSRPWNNFTIKLKDRYGNPLLSYEGNWRDIFQNWEALALSFPEFVENMIAKFVNASTMDGYNPYRVTKDGIDWEVEDPEDPWSYIGYWGDHQIIYLQKLLEISKNYHPERLGALLHERIFAYANVPYRIKSFDALYEDPKNTVTYADEVAENIERLEEELGFDAKLIRDAKGDVLQVTLLEKLLVPLLSKLGNLVVDGGIWMNTQRPEWNDANNALVGQGLSMVTLCYMRRYVQFLSELLEGERDSIELSAEVAGWLSETTAALARFRPVLDGDVSPAERLALLTELGEAASRFRDTVYANLTLSAPRAVPLGEVRQLLADTLVAIDHSIDSNRRDDGLFDAYNLLTKTSDGVQMAKLYPMLEGQVAALSTGSLDPALAISVIESLFDSPVYRPDQDTFMLYPDRDLPDFLEKNRIAESDIDRIPLLQALVADGNDRVIIKDANGNHRFSAEFANVADLEGELSGLPDRYADQLSGSRDAILQLFEQIFDHQSFTGRSGTMFGFEGLGCVYWHMVSKLLLAVQETYFQAADGDADPATVRKLGELYYRVRQGIGFNKSPDDFGAFPADPYSHTPKHSGARQPGMTGQVKEEIVTRFGELGIRVRNGELHFEPELLRQREFVDSERPYCYLEVDGAWSKLDVPANGLAYTMCQVPVVYQLVDDGATSVTIHYDDGEEKTQSELRLSADDSAELFARTGRIRRLTLTFGKDLLFGD